MRLQFSIRVLLGTLSLVAVCLACDRVYKRWYAQKYAAHYLSSLLQHRVHNGDALEDVSQQFETAVKLDATHPNILKVWNSRSLPIRPKDEFWHFGHSSGHGVYLQLRDGRLINHQASDYADPDRVAALNHFPVPPVLFRHGVWPICTLILAVGGWILFVTDKKVRPGAKAKET